MAQEALINEYEGIKSNLFNHLKKVALGGQDNNSLEFDNNIQLDKKRLIYISIHLNQKKVYMTMYMISIVKQARKYIAI